MRTTSPRVGCGSDVSRATGTVALEVDAPEYGPNVSHTLHGVKWFASAIDGDVALALARAAAPDSVGPDGATIPGGRDERLTLFLVQLRHPTTKALQNMEIMKLKDKLGTQQLPSAELRLCGAPARQLSVRGKGIAAIAEMLNVTRMWNSVTAVGTTRRAVALAMDYATRRRAFGKRLIDLPLHVETLCAMEVELRANRHFVAQVALLLGKRECNTASDTEQALLRLLTPVMKAYTAKHSVRICSEAIEAIGGQAYTEDSGVPLLLRDAQVLPVWEGTTNIMSLDVLRVLAKTKGAALSAFISHGREILVRCRTTIPDAACKLLAKRLGALADYGRDLLSQMDKKPLAAQAFARNFLFELAHCNAGLLLLEHAHFTAKRTDLDTLIRYMESKAAPLCVLPSSLRQRTLVSRSILGADTIEATPNTYRQYGPSF